MTGLGNLTLPFHNGLAFTQLGRPQFRRFAQPSEMIEKAISQTKNKALNNKRTVIASQYQHMKQQNLEFELRQSLIVQSSTRCNYVQNCECIRDFYILSFYRLFHCSECKTEDFKH